MTNKELLYALHTLPLDVATRARRAARLADGYWGGPDSSPQAVEVAKIVSIEIVLIASGALSLLERKRNAAA